MREDRDTRAMAGLLAAAGVPHELLGPEEASERWQYLHIRGPVPYHPDADVVVDADRTVEACVRRAIMVYGHGPSHTLRPGDALQFDGEAPHGPERLVELPIRFLTATATATAFGDSPQHRARAPGPVSHPCGMPGAPAPPSGGGPTPTAHPGPRGGAAPGARRLDA